MESYEDWYDDFVKAYPEYKKIEFRPFGGYNYSYGKDWERTASFTQWAGVTVSTQ